MRKLIKSSALFCTLIILVSCSSPVHNEAGGAADAPDTVKNEAGTNKITLRQDPAGTLTIYNFYEDGFIEEAAKKFEAEHKGVDIVVTSFYDPEILKSAGGGGGEVAEQPDAMENYVLKINTELTAGKGGDLFSTDYLPLYKYADSKTVMDLQPLLEEDALLDNEDYFGRIFEAMKYKGGLYSLPMAFTYQYFEFNNASKGNLLTGGDEFDKAIREGTAADIHESPLTFDQALAKAKKISDATGQPLVSSGRGLFELLFTANIGEFIDIENKTVDIDNDRFTGLLSLAVSLSDGGKSKGQPVLRDMLCYKERLSIQDDSVPIAGDSGKVYALTFTNYAINNHSKNKALAWEFLKYCISADAQESTQLSGLPVRRKALERWIDLSIRQMLTGMDDTYYKNLAKYIFGRTESNINMINAYNHIDYPLVKIVLDEAGYCFTGIKTPEEAAGNLQNKISTILQE